MRCVPLLHQPKKIHRQCIGSLRASFHINHQRLKPRAVDSYRYKRSGFISESDCSKASRPSSLSQLHSSLQWAIVNPTDLPSVPEDLDFFTPADMKRTLESFSKVKPARLLLLIPGNFKLAGRSFIMTSISA